MSQQSKHIVGQDIGVGVRTSANHGSVGCGQVEGAANSRILQARHDPFLQQRRFLFGEQHLVSFAPEQILDARSVSEVNQERMLVGGRPQLRMLEKYGGG